jgi:hypothetical protein|tara:strand:+ start:2334 stop:2783 length:450 start_codon:yes stop_codon:yes gene_type:complete
MIKLIDILSEIDYQSKLSRGHKPDYYQLGTSKFIPFDEDETTEAKKRIARKKGQKKKSSKHSDLFTDEDPKGTIHGLGFKDAATARKGVGIINKAKRTHAHKVQATLVMKQRAKVAKERTKDPEKKKNLNKAYQIWSNKLEQLKKKTKK